MHPFIKHQSCIALVLASGALSCGKVGGSDTVSHRGKSTEALRASSSNLEINPQLSLKGTLLNEGSTGQRIHELRSKLDLDFDHLASLGLSGQENLVFKMVIHDAEKRPVWESEQESKIPVSELLWSPRINGGEGEYTLEVEVWAKVEGGKKAVTFYRSNFVLDTSTPVMAIEAKLSPINDEGLRDLGISTQIYNESRVNCAEASILHPSLALPILVKLTSTQSEGRIILSGKGTGLSAAVANGNVLVKVSCKDEAGNQTDLIQAATPDGERPMGLAFTLDAKRGHEFGSSEAQPMRYFLGKPELEVKLGLIDPQTGLPHSQAVVAAEKSTLRVYLTESAPSSVDELLNSKTVLWNQIFAPSIKLALPGSWQGAHNLYLSLLRYDISQNKSTLIASSALPIFIDGVGAELKWLSGPSFAAPVKDSPLTLKASVLLTGAPLGAQIQAEYSEDASAWKPLAITSNSLNGNSSEIRFNYPLAGETPFRLRLKAQDLAGNISYSPVSSQIVARSGLPSLSVSAAQREACVNGNAPGARLRPLLLSRYLCRKSDALGQAVGNAHASLLLQNLGQVQPTFYSTSQISEGMGYKVLGDGRVLAEGRMAPPDLFRLSIQDQRLMQFTVYPAWLTAKRLEVVFDAEESDAYSTTNSCYPNEAPFPSVLLQNVDQGLSLQMSPFACDQEGLLAP